MTQEAIDEAYKCLRYASDIDAKLIDFRNDGKQIHLTVDSLTYIHIRAMMGWRGW